MKKLKNIPPDINKAFVLKSLPLFQDYYRENAKQWKNS